MTLQNSITLDVYGAAQGQLTVLVTSIQEVVIVKEKNNYILKVVLTSGRAYYIIDSLGRHSYNSLSEAVIAKQELIDQLAEALNTELNIDIETPEVPSDESVPSTKFFLDKLDNKVDAIPNKGLTTNDYTDTDKAKVAKISVTGDTQDFLGADGIYKKPLVNWQEQIYNKPVFPDQEQIDIVLDEKLSKKTPITPGTKPKITYNQEGLVVGGESLSESDIPNLQAEKIVSGQFHKNRIPDLPAEKINSGTFNEDQIPELPASKITSGVLNKDRLPDIDINKVTNLKDILIDITEGLDEKLSKKTPITPGTKPKITYNQEGLVVSGEALTASDIPNIPAEKITSGSFHKDRIPNLPAEKINSGVLDKDQIPEIGISKVVNLRDTLLSLEALIAQKAPIGTPDIDASNVVSGKLNKDRIPSLDASKITSGKLNQDVIPNLNASKVSSGVLQQSQIPSIPLSKVSDLQEEILRINNLLFAKAPYNGKYTTNLSFNPHTYTLTWRELGGTYKQAKILLEALPVNIIFDTETNDLVLTLSNDVTARVNISNMIQGTAKSVNDILPDENGNIPISMADIPGLTETLEDILNSTTLTNYYTKLELDDIVADIGSFEFTNYYTKEQLDLILTSKISKIDPVTAGTFTKVTINTDGLVSSGGFLTQTDIPSLDASKITTGKLNQDRLPNLDASKITTGKLPSEVIPLLQEEKIAGLPTRIVNLQKDVAKKANYDSSIVKNFKIDEVRKLVTWKTLLGTEYSYNFLVNEIPINMWFDNDSNELVIEQQDLTELRIDVSYLVASNLKKINNRVADSQGNIDINIEDIPGLAETLAELDGGDL